MAETFRAFVAVAVGPLPGMVSLLDGLRATGADVKLVEPENLHATVKFLGDTSEDHVPAIREAIERAVADADPVEVRLEGVRTFGPRRSPRVVQVPMVDDGTLAGIAARLEDALAEAGLAEREKRPFKAHVTLARPRPHRDTRAVVDFVKAHENASAGHVRVDALRLMRSDLSQRGPTYTEVARIPFGGA